MKFLFEQNLDSKCLSQTSQSPNIDRLQFQPTLNYWQERRLLLQMESNCIKYRRPSEINSKELKSVFVNINKKRIEASTQMAGYSLVVCDM